MCDQLESQLRDKEERHLQELSLRDQQLEAAIERFNTERKELVAKIDALTQSLNSKERDLMMTKARQEQLREDHDKRVSVMNMLK